MPALLNAIEVFLTDDEFLALHRAAKLSGKDSSTIGRRAIVGAVRQILADAPPPKRTGRPPSVPGTPAGVRWNPQRSRWRVFVKAPNHTPGSSTREVYVGLYADLEIAVAAQRAAQEVAGGPVGASLVRAEGDVPALVADIDRKIREAAKRAVRDYRAAHAAVPADVRDAIMG